MDALTAKTNEIRRLHAVCRAKNDAVRQAYLGQITSAKQYHREALHFRRKRDVFVYANNIDKRDACMHAARVLKQVLKELE